MSCTDRIQALDDAVVAGIAAGEVVERPASIVKELVENSLDAEASRVIVSYDDEPATRIVVIDDGRGIAADQLELAVSRHATSKIRTLDDLERIATFGFRGEALSSIAAVCRFEVISRTAEAVSGARIVLQQGEVVLRAPAGTRLGTRIVVSDLFENVPARRKFLKTTSAEYALAADVLRRFALARPDVQFRLERKARVVYEHPAVDGLTERLRQVWGREIGASMVELDTRYKGLRLRGAVSSAGTSWGSARRLSLFVNGRWVQERSLFRAVMEAYRTYLIRGRYPAAVLFLDVDPAHVDVNVHPQKLEVRFADTELVSRFVIESVRDALRGAASPLGRWGLSEGRLTARDRAWRGRELSPRPPVASAVAPEPVAADAGRPIPAGYVPPSTEALLSVAPDPEPAEQTSMFVAEPGALDDLEVVGQVFAGYIICQRGNEMVLIDQHAAHERVIFERLMRAVEEGGVESQGLVAPVVITVGGEGVEAIARFADRLRPYGWELDVFGEEDAAVRAVQTTVAGSDIAVLSERLVADLVRTEPTTAGRRLAEMIMATVACHAAVRVGKRLEAAGARALLHELESVDFAACCPHGRPVARTFQRSEVERLFGR